MQILAAEFTSVNINSTYSKLSINKRFLKSATAVVWLKTEKSCGKNSVKIQVFQMLNPSYSIW